MGIKRKGMTIVSEPIKSSGNGKRWWEERRERETEKGPPFLLYPIGGGGNNWERESCPSDFQHDDQSLKVLTNF